MPFILGQISEYTKVVYLLFTSLCYFFLGLLPVSSACLEFSPHTVLPFSFSTQCQLHFFSDFTPHLNNKLAHILITLPKFRSCLFEVVPRLPNTSLYRPIQNDKNKDNVAFVLKLHTLYLTDLYFVVR